VNAKPKIAIVGYGKVGRVLARALPEAGYKVAAVVTRQQGIKLGESKILGSVRDLSAGIGLVILCLRDDEIAKAVEALNPHLQLKGWESEPFPTACGGDQGGVSGCDDPSPPLLLKGGTKGGLCHTAGALSSEILAPARTKGWEVMAWHPLMTFTGSEGAELLRGVTFGIDGDEGVVAFGEQLARDLGGIPFRVPPELRGTYHLSAVFACNLLIALLGESLELLNSVGVDQQRAMQALLPLIHKTVENVAEKGFPDSITGPVRRGDVATITRHLDILSKHPEADGIYRTLSLALARRLENGVEQDAVVGLLLRK